MAIDIQDLKKLSPRNKALILLLLFLLIGYFDYMFLLEAALTKRSGLDAKLTDLTQQVADKERLVAQLARHIQEVNVLQATFKQALQKLPNEREIAGLLATVVLSGRNAGVDFILFEPKPPEKKPPEAKPADAKPAAPKPPDAKPGEAKGPPSKPPVPEKFYDEIPIKVQLSGGYHSTLSFFEQVAKLPRIINIGEIVMSDAQVVKNRGRIVKTSCTIKTYMFVDRK